MPPVGKTRMPTPLDYQLGNALRNRVLVSRAESPTGHDPPAQCVEHNREVEKSRPRWYVGEISDPKVVRLIGSEIAFHKIGS
jgi:hypothetical protein